MTSAAPAGTTLVRLDAGGLAAQRAALADILVDCVEGGASIGYVLPFGRAEAERFWDDLAPGVASGSVVLLAALQAGRAVGTVQLHPSPKPNQRHRADVSKLLVHRSARGRGLGAALMHAIEAEARQRGRWLLVLDTSVGGGAERLYDRLGWTAFGVCPDYAAFPDGRLGGAAFYWKRL